MAERQDSENLTHSQINSCEDFFDLCCTPCSKKNLNKRVLKYCVTCKEYFCVTCVESHNSFQALSGHLLLNPQISKSSQSMTGGSKLHVIPTELCQHHPMEVVNMYCGNEDIVGCSVCFTSNHRSCDDIHYIPEYVQSHFPAKLVDRINNDLTKAINAMKKLKTQHDKLDDNLDKSIATCKQEIQKYRKEINQIIDKIESTTLAELDARHKDLKNDTNESYLDKHGIHDEMLRLKSKIESNQSNEAQKFVITKLSQSLIMRGRKLQSKLSNNQTTELKFTRNSDIMTYLLSITTLGLLSPPVKQDFSLPTVPTSSKQLSTQPISSSASTDTSDKSGVSTRQAIGCTNIWKPHNPGPFRELDKSEYTIQQPDDKSICDISSSCILEYGYILLADCNNNNLKLVDGRTYTVRSSLALNGRPWSVCRVSSTEAAVYLDNSTIQFVSISSTSGDTLVPVRSILMKHYGKFIAVIRDKMYVGGAQSVNIYTLNGKHVQTIRKDKAGNDIFSLVWNITVSDDENMIHVADLNVGVITLNTDGIVVWRYSGTELGRAYGICTDGNGNVIVSCDRSNNVIQLGPDGQYKGHIISHSDGVISPHTVCYDIYTHKLIVGRSNNNNIIVLTLVPLH